MIVNKLNGKCYVGSTKSIKIRFYNYFNLAHHLSQKGRPISSAPGLRPYRFSIQILQQRRSFSNQRVEAVVTYANADTQKLDILISNKNKSGIYR